MKRQWCVLAVICLFLAVLVPVGADAAKRKKPMPKLTVSRKQAVLVQARMDRDGSGQPIFRARVRNKSSKGTIRKIEFIYSVNVSNPNPVPAVESGDAAQAQPQNLSAATVKLVAKNIKPGQRSGTVSCVGDASGQVAGMKLKTIRLYAGTALCIYNASTGKTTVRWGTEDKKAPVISGWVGRDSCVGTDTRLVCYSDWKDSFDFKKYVSVKDDRDAKVKLKVDTSRINWEKDGIYKVYYRASDRAGNEAAAWAKVQVYVTGTAERIADQVLKSVTKRGDTDEKIAREVYRYVKRHCSYVDNGSHKNWRKEAMRGLRYESGDCFTYYAMSRLLITRAGIPNLMLTRYPASEGYHHWWNLLYVRGGWYHFDTTPRKRKTDFCLLTDAQLAAYPTKSTFRYEENRYPKRAKKKISPDIKIVS